MLMALFIAGLMAGALILTLPQAKSDLDRFGQTLLKDFNRHAQNAVLTGQTHGIELSVSDYRLTRFENGAWQTTTIRHWPEQSRIEFITDTIPLPLTQTPHLLIFFEPTGLSSTFRLNLHGIDNSYSLDSKGDGRIIYSPPPV